MSFETTPAERHKMALQFIVEQYQHGMVLALSWLFQSGEVPGFETISPRKLTKFFESTNEAYWVQLLQTDPAEAMSQLQQWEQSAPKGDAPQEPVAEGMLSGANVAPAAPVEAGVTP